MAGASDPSIDERLIVSALINRKINTLALIDTGASCSVMSSRLFEKINCPLIGSDIKLTGFDGKASQVLGNVEIHFALKSSRKEIKIKALVVPDVTPDFILGIGDMQRLGFKLAGPNGVECLQNKDNARICSNWPYVDVATVKEAKDLGDDIVIIKTWSQRSGIISPSNSHCYFLDGVINEGYNNLVVRSTKPAKDLVNTVIGHIEPVDCAVHVKVFHNAIINFHKDKFKFSETDSVSPVSVASTSIVNNDSDRLDKLWSLVAPKVSSCSAEEKEVILGWLRDFSQTFALAEDPLGYTDRGELVIDTGTHPPINSKPYKLPLKYQESVNLMIEDSLKRGLIRESSSPWGSPLFLVPKRDAQGGKSDIRLVVDYRKLNNITVKSVHPIPLIDETLSKLQGNNYFTSLDLVSGFWQMAVSKCSIEKTAFSTPSGHWEWLVMPFGLANAPIAFQRLMNSIFQPQSNQSLNIYIDDIISSGKTLTEADNNVRGVLKTLENCNLKVKLVKCNFLQKEINFLGHVVNRTGISPDPQKLSALNNITVPTNKKAVRRFLGAVGYYSKFIENYAAHARPLQKLTGDVPFIWTELHQSSFDHLRSCLKSQDLLIFPNPNKPFLLTTNASDEALGGILSQECDGFERPIYFLSRSLKSAETRYPTYEKELLAIIHCLEKTRPYILGQKVVILSDHKPLKWLLTNPKALSNTRLSRWVINLMEFDLEIKHIDGKSNKVADWLSRDLHSLLESRVEHEVSDKAKIPGTECQNINAVGLPHDYLIPNKKNYLYYQHKDEYLLYLHFCLEQQMPLENQGKGRNTIKLDELINIEGILHLRGPNGTVKLIVPSALRHSVMQIAHSSRGKIHTGKTAMLEDLKAQFYWPKMGEDVKEYISTCHICLSTKVRRLPEVPILHVDRGREPWELLHLDLIGPLKRSESGNRYILNVCDSFSKFCLLFPLQQKTMKEVHDVFENKILKIWGPMKKIVTDSGKEFKNFLFQELCEEWEIIHATSSAYHPAFNGKVERVNAVVARMLCCLLEETRLEWDQLLGDIMYCINNRVSRVIGVTPFSVMFGHSARMPSKMMEPENFVHPPEFPLPTYLRQRSDINFERWALINTLLDKADDYVPRDALKDILLCGNEPILKGDFVYVNIPKGGHTKLNLKYPGPYLVFEQVTPVSYRLQNLVGGANIVIHESRIVRQVPYIRDEGIPNFRKVPETPNALLPEEIDTPLENESQNDNPFVDDVMKSLPPLISSDLNPLKEVLGDSMVNTQQLVFGKDNNMQEIGSNLNSLNNQSENNENVIIERPRRNLTRVNYKLLNTGRR